MELWELVDREVKRVDSITEKVTPEGARASRIAAKAKHDRRQAENKTYRDERIVAVNAAIDELHEKKRAIRKEHRATAAKISEAMAAEIAEAWKTRGPTHAPESYAGAIQQLAPTGANITVDARKKVVTIRSQRATARVDLVTSEFTTRGYVPLAHIRAGIDCIRVITLGELPNGWHQAGLTMRYDNRRQVRLDLQARAICIMGSAPVEVVRFACVEMSRLLGE